jgi:PTH1 family peptidyl-tRNA hydrolase
MVGLGNPGGQYEDTRHNAGFWFVDELARRHGGAFRREAKFSAEACRVRVGADEAWLLKPQTFMNRSGSAVRAAARFYKVPPEAILIAHDEIDLPPGTTRLKRAGGHGGHNGLRDSIAQIGAQFLRLRIGVGHPGNKDQVVDYVLHRPGRDEEALIRADIDAAADLLPELLGGELDKAMQRLHSRGA